MPLPASGGIPFPAARDADGSCNSGDFCGWHHDNHGGGIMDAYYPEGNYAFIAFWGTQTPIGDSVSSVRNRFNVYDVGLYKDDTWSGYMECFPRQMTESKNLGSTMEDQASSHQGISDSTC